MYVCEACKRDDVKEPFRVPADEVGRALMAEHLRQHIHPSPDAHEGCRIDPDTGDCIDRNCHEDDDPLDNEPDDMSGPGNPSGDGR